MAPSARSSALCLLLLICMLPSGSYYSEASEDVIQSNEENMCWFRRSNDNCYSDEECRDVYCKGYEDGWCKMNLFNGICHCKKPCSA